MKLLYITNGITGSGGLERVLSIKASRLAENFGYEVHIAALNEDETRPAFFPFSSLIKRHEMLVSERGFSYIKQYRSEIERIVAEVRPDVISVCDDGLKGFFIPRILRTKIPIVYERHASINIGRTPNGIANIKNGIQHRIMKRLAKDFSKFVVLTTGNLKEWHTANVEVVPNPVSFYPDTSSTLENKRVIVVGSHSYNKGYDLLLEVWKRIQTNFPNWTLEIYGRSSTTTYQDLSKDLGLVNVEFYPPVQYIEKKYLESSVLAFPSRSEGFGMVIIEAMSCGVPVVSFDCPHGPGDILTDGEDGFLVENGNIDTFAKKLGKLLADVNLRKKMGKAAKENAKAYLPENVVRHWDNLFRELSQKRR